MRHSPFLAVLALLPLLAGCVDPGWSAITDLSDVSKCAAAVDFAKAPLLPLNNGSPAELGFFDRAEHTVGITVASCLEENGVRESFTAVALPIASKPTYLKIETGIQASFGRYDFVMRPRLLTYDVNHQLVRTIDPWLFKPDGRELSILLEIQPEERYLVARSAPRQVGGKSEHMISQQRKVDGSSTYFFPQYVTEQRPISYVFSYNGALSFGAYTNDK